MYRQLTVTILLALVLFADLSIAADALVEHARARETKAKTIDIVFAVTEHCTKGSISDGSGKSTVIPASDTVLQSTNRLILDGHSVRYEHSHPIWHINTGSQPNKPFISVSNGTYSKVYHPAGIGNEDSPAGVIGKGPECLDIKYYLLAPLTMHFRGTMPNIAPYPLTNAKPTGRTSVIDKTPCQEYTIPVSTDRAVHLWVDPEQSYAIRRLSIIWRGHTMVQTDVRYDRSEAGVPLPTEWKRSKFGQDGKLLITTEVRVDTSTLNASHASEQFDVIFPTGSNVYDQRNAQSYQVDRSGEMQLLSPKGEQQNERVAQPGTPWLQRNRWLVSVSAVSVLFLALGWVVRKRYFSRAT